MVQRMRQAANPVVSKRTHRVVEYPVGAWKGDRLLADVDADSGNCTADVANYMCLSEDFDLGHRHFSSLHWMYPGTFLPTAAQSQANRRGLTGRTLVIDPHLLEAAHRTLADRSAHMSGHTG